MKNYFLLVIAAAFCFSCMKKDTPPPNSNEFHAQLTFSEGSSSVINETGYSTHMGCSNGTTLLQGNNDSVSLGISINIGHCITTTGTYTNEFECQVTNNSLLYIKDPAKPGSISFTTGEKGFMEGSFHIVCYNGNDSVLVSGTFEGKLQY